MLPAKTVLLCCTASVGEYAITEIPLTTNQQFNGLVIKGHFAKRLDPDFLFTLTSTFKNELMRLSGKTSFNFVSGKVLKKLTIPLPPLEVQQEIVTEIEGYQRVIDGARAVLENYRPYIAVDPGWAMVALGDICDFKRGPFGGSLKKDIFVKEGYAIYEQSHAISANFNSFRYFIDDLKYESMKAFTVYPNDLIMSCSGTMGRTAIVPDSSPPGIINQALLRLRAKDQVLTPFLKLWMDDPKFQRSIDNVTFGAAIRNVASVKTLKSLKIPLPPLPTQRDIIAELEAEQALANANRQLIGRMETNIRAAIGRVWGQGEPAASDP